MTTRYGEAGDENALLTRAQSGDGAAFRLLVEPHRDTLYGVCLRITGDRQEAEDALQNALLAAWQNLGRFEGRSKVSTWLYRIAHNAALAIARKRVPEPIDPVDVRTPTLGRVDDRVTDVEAVQWALSRIPPDFRAALVLREYADLTYEDIAETVGIPVATVKTRIARARRAVAVLLGED